MEDSNISFFTTVDDVAEGSEEGFASIGESGASIVNTWARAKTGLIAKDRRDGVEDGSMQWQDKNYSLSLRVMMVEESICGMQLYKYIE